MKELIPRVAVCLAAYNGSVYIAEQIESILQQREVDVTIFISIDPSTDGSEDLCLHLARQHENIAILPNVGKFGGASKNFFRLIRDVDFSNFDYLAFADQDDIWFEDKLSTAANKIIETKSDGYSSNVMAFWPTGGQQLIVKSQPQCEWDYLFEAAGPGCTYVMTVKLALEIKNTVASNWLEVNKLELHDWFCYAFARAKGFVWFIDSLPSMLYRQHSNNQVGVNKGWKAISFRLTKVLSGWGFEQSLLVAKLVGKSNEEFVKSWCSLDRYCFLILASKSMQCRRKPLEKGLFFFVCLLMTVIRKQP